MLDAETMAKRKNILFNGINVFEEAPFTLQRICEILDTNGRGFTSVACGMEVNTHSHMFFECRRTKFLREQADRFASLIYVHKPFKYTIPWNENFFWGDWGTKDPKPPITRCIMLCTLSTMWKAIGTNIRISITENIENFVNAQIAVARNIRNEEGRAKTIAIINKQWKLEKLWLSKTGFPSLKHKTVTYTNGNTLGKDPRRKLPLDDG